MKFYSSKQIFLILFPCLLAFGLRSAAGQSDHTAKLVEEAKKEGKLVWYTAWNARDSKLMQDGFEKRYSFVKMEVLRSSGEKILNRIISEARAGQWLFDVVNTTSLGALVHYKLLSQYVSPEAKALMAEFRDPTGYWIATSTIYTVIGYNTKMVAGKEVPKKWEDLLDPKWKGKISIDQEEYPWYATLLAVWGREPNSQQERDKPFCSPRPGGRAR